MDGPGFDPEVAAVRRFNRFYTQKIGVLQESLLDTPFSLTEARVLYELAHRQAPTASVLARDLTLDPGYLSRILRDFARQGFVEKRPSASDGRQQELRLTEAGRAAFAPLDRATQSQIGTLLATLPAGDRRRLLAAMGEIETLLGARPDDAAARFTLRPHGPGDLGWVVERHGALYAREYGWTADFEALVAEIAARFIRNFDPARERCWIAERGGERVGSVMVVAKSKTVAKLRLLIVEPRARGLGIGARLVAECIDFARAAGYRRLVLWTNANLHAARRLYEAAGFLRIAAEPHHSFGHDLVGETWELKL